MTFVRQVRLDAAVGTGYPKYRAMVAASPESTIVLGCWIETGGSGPPLHLHACDQFYVFLAGHTTVQVGSDVQEVGAGDVIFIPAGLPHCNWNNSGAQEHHLEIMAPGVRPGLPLLTAVTSVDEVPMPAAASYTRTLDAGEASSAGARTQWTIADEACGVRSARLHTVEVAKCKAPSDPRVLDVDHLMFVLDGRLTLAIAGQDTVSDAQSLIVIPAGVAHCQWNPSSSPVRYLDVQVPAPEMYRSLAPFLSTQLESEPSCLV
ncbi:MAG: cupin domain-containing protein [Acidimicrobiales bacterium]|jgi:mannose-6-phosphate isomerase-like protein (cupin superfamily)